MPCDYEKEENKFIFKLNIPLNIKVPRGVNKGDLIFFSKVPGSFHIRFDRMGTLL